MATPAAACHGSDATHHACGYPLYVNHQVPEGKSPEWVDVGQGSQTIWNVITHCPHCNEDLSQTVPPPQSTWIVQIIG